MVAKRHKITNVPLFKKLWDIIFFGDNNFLKVIVRKKKIMSLNFLNSGTLIVIRYILSLFETFRPNTQNRHQKIYKGIL
jgi:hypothetical protein